MNFDMEDRMQAREEFSSARAKSGASRESLACGNWKIWDLENLQWRYFNLPVIENIWNLNLIYF